MSFRLIALAALGLAITACASGPVASPATPAASATPAPSAETKTPAPSYVAAADDGRLAAIAAATKPLDKDRLAILGMLGEFEVSFDFIETAALVPDYTRKKTKSTGGFETVLLVENSGRKIVLQHLLVSEDGYITKHWRQDWEYEASERLEFSEDQTWRLRPIAAARTRGAWTQCVYEVNDAPRYCGTGKWAHRDGVATWTSDHSWRPLPRREYTTRKDYNAIDAINRHTLTPSGWTHEQDNTKVVRTGERSTSSLVREFGFNDYRRISGFNFSPATAYWTATQKYWAQVRGQWQTRIDAGKGIRLKTPLDGMPLIIPLFELADAVQEGKPVDSQAITAAFDQWTATPPPSPKSGS